MTERSHDVAVDARLNSTIQNSATTGGKKISAPFFRTNRGIGIGLLACFAALAASIVFSDWAGRVLRDGFLLGGFPLFATGFMILAALILIFDGQAKTVDPDVARFRLSALIIVLVATAVLGLAFLSMDIIGFIPMVILLVGGSAAILGYRPVWSAFLVGLAVASALRLIMYLLDVEVEDGVFWHFVARIIHG